MVSAIVLSVLLPAHGIAFEATPKDRVNAFVKALQNSSTNEVRSLVIGASSNQKLAQLFSKYRDVLSYASISGLRVETTGARAKASFKVPVTQKTQVADHLDLKKVGSQWMIVPPENPDMCEQLSISWFASIIADQAKSIWAIELLDLALCVGNAKSLGTSMLIFIAGQDGVFKFAGSQSGAMAAIKPFIKNESVRKCPTTGKSYSFNTRLAGKSADDIDEPSRTVMFYEGSNEKLDYAHADGATVIFADRSAKQVSAAEAKKLRWSP